MFVLPTLAALISIASSSGTGQLGGAAATYGRNQRSALETARQNELSFRLTGKEEGRFIEASVLMNVPADEYVAMFGINEEGKTLDEARSRIDARIKEFEVAASALKIAAADIFVDFVAQNRIYAYVSTSGGNFEEVLAGFEVKKTVAIHYNDKAMLDVLLSEAAKSQIFDLVKVDYIVKDTQAVQTKLVAEAGRVLKRKIKEQEQLLGLRVGKVSPAISPRFGIYFPTELYDSYEAQEAEQLQYYGSNINVKRARKAKTFYFNPFTAKDFDFTFNPAITEPMVQFTVYVRVKY